MSSARHARPLTARGLALRVLRLDLVEVLALTPIGRSGSHACILSDELFHSQVVHRDLLLTLLSLHG